MNQLTTQTKLLQKAVLVVEGKFLILKRSPQSQTRPNQWDLPGGNSEWPKPVNDVQNGHIGDLIREIEEETGVLVSTDKITQPIYFGTYFEGRKQLYTIIVGWQVNLPAKPLVKISDEHTEYTWIKAEDFDQFEFGFAGSPDGFIRQMVFSASNL